MLIRQLAEVPWFTKDSALRHQLLRAISGIGKVNLGNGDGTFHYYTKCHGEVN